MPDAQPLILPLSVLFAALAAFAGLAILSCWMIRKLLRDPSAARRERDWSIPVIDAGATGNSVIHRWDVRFKVAGLLCFALCCVATRSLPGAVAALLLAFAMVLLARLPLARSLRRLLAMSGFLGMFLLVMPLTAATRPGDPLLIFAGLEALPLNLRGFWLAVAIIAKACAVALLMEPLLATAPLARTVAGLTGLGVPEKVAQMILLAHRYIFVFVEEARRMAVGMQVRGFRRRTDTETLRVMGNFLGMLFVRSFERTYRVYDAMQARGYEGRLPSHERFAATVSDSCLLGCWLLLGALLLAADRFWLAG